MKVNESVEVSIDEIKDSIDDLNRRDDVVEMITVAVGLTVVAVCGGICLLLFWG
tara:strand:- start:7095 stop:7256 length:162 start_codon:yes stop_codon:yes gene_type:complete